MRQAMKKKYRKPRPFFGKYIFAAGIEHSKFATRGGNRIYLTQSDDIDHPYMSAKEALKFADWLIRAARHLSQPPLKDER